MNKQQALELLIDRQIVAVIRLDDLSNAEALSEALLDAGIRVLEFTLTNPDAIDVVSNLRKNLSVFDSGEAIIGIGSIRNREQAQRAVDAGAQLLVSPTLLMDMIEVGQTADVLTAPAGFTPTEIDTAYQAGADVVKIFPASTVGASYIKDILAPMPELRIMPTGGINLDNINDYLDAGAVAVGIGGSFFNKRYLETHNWQAIGLNAARYVSAIKRKL